MTFWLSRKQRGERFKLLRCSHNMSIYEVTESQTSLKKTNLQQCATRLAKSTYIEFCESTCLEFILLCLEMRSQRTKLVNATFLIVCECYAYNDQKYLPWRNKVRTVQQFHLNAQSYSLQCRDIVSILLEVLTPRVSSMTFCDIVLTHFFYLLALMWSLLNLQIKKEIETVAFT